MTRKTEKSFNWQGFWTFIAAVGAILAVAGTIAPAGQELTYLLGGLIIIGVLAVGYAIFPQLRAFYTRHGRMVVLVVISFFIPVTQIVFLEPSVIALIATSLQALIILLLIRLSREWRTIKPYRTDDSTSEPFVWGGILDDEVGRGPGSDGPDGAPDAKFILRSSKPGAILDRIRLQRINPVTRMNTRQVWRSERHQLNWILGVNVDDQRIKPDSKGRLGIKVVEDTVISLFVSDDWFPSSWFKSGQIYEVELDYRGIDQKESHSLTIP